MANSKSVKDIPVTQKMLDSIDERFTSIDKRFDSIDERFASIDKRFDAVDAQFVRLDAKIDSNHQLLMGQIHRLGILMEEQNRQNKYVMDGLVSLFERQDRLEKFVYEKLP